MRITAITLTILAAGSAASADGVDIWLSEANGQLQIGAFDKDDNEFFAGVQVFEAFFGESTDGNFPDETDEPGWYTETLPPGTAYGFNILDGLRVWDGDFDQLANETLTVTADSTDPGAPSATTGGLGEFVPGFFFTSPDGSGFFDSHIDFVLADPAADGIYLLNLEATSDTFATSGPLWIVFSQNIPDEQLELAVEFVEENIVPAPGAAALGLLGLAGLARRRRA